MQFCGCYSFFYPVSWIFFRALLIKLSSGGFARSRASMPGSTHVVGGVYKLLGAEVQAFHQAG